MKKLIPSALLCSLLALSSAPAFAVEGGEVQLRATTIPGLTLDEVGRFDLTTPENLVFESGGKTLVTIPWDRIAEFQSADKAAHHLGVVAAIGVGLVKHRRQRHYLSITFKDDSGKLQMVNFEIAKDLPDIMTSALYSKARSACERREYGACMPVTSGPFPRQSLTR